MAESYPKDRKTLWEKEKLLVTSNFPFSHSVFKRLTSQGRQKVSLCGNGLTKNPIKMKNPKGIPKNALIISHQFLFFFIFLLILKIFKCVLTLYHTIPTFNDPKEEDFGKDCGKRRKCW